MCGFRMQLGNLRTFTNISKRKKIGRMTDLCTIYKRCQELGREFGDLFLSEFLALAS